MNAIITNHDFIGDVAAMRELQKSYFALSARARKTKLPGDFASAAVALKQAKALEAKVDAELVGIRSHGVATINTTVV